MNNLELNKNEYESINYLKWNKIFSIFKRRKIFITSGLSAGIFLGGLYLLLKKPVWEGEFQIVVSNKDESKISAALMNTPGLAKFAGIDQGSNKLETEVKILESSSVLNPIFNYVKDFKKEKGIDTSQWRFRIWKKNNFNIQIAKKTSVLNVKYKDKDKDLILNVLNKISSAYQIYSGRDRKRSLENGIVYLDDQIKIFKERSLNSLRTAQSYAIDQDLAILSSNEVDQESVNNLNIEGIRISAANQIRLINENLKRLNNVYSKNENKSKLVSQISLIEEISSTDLFRELEGINARLQRNKYYYKDFDEEQIKLKNRFNVLSELFYKKAINLLEAKLNEARAKFASAERPKGVLIKYNELLRKAIREEGTLQNLESQRLFTGLELAKNQQPWDLISKAQLSNRPIAPRKKRSLGLFLIAGFSVGVLLAFIKEKREGIIYEIDDFKNFLPYKLIKSLNKSEINEWDTIFNSLKLGPLLKNKSSIVIIYNGSDPNSYYSKFYDKFKAIFKDKKVKLTNQLSETLDYESQLLIFMPSQLKMSDLREFDERLILQGNKIDGWFYIDLK
tara:strand:- start:1072 stop:2763 length:1692 start_codon:yes stop_codon:yes gene_type:complete